MLILKGVSQGFQDGPTFRWLFENLTFEFQKLESVVLWGPSGSGKTTLLNLLAGLQRPLNGSIVFNQNSPFDITEANEKELLLYRRHRIGYIYQFFNLIPTLTVLENVELPLELTSQLNLLPFVRETLCEFGLENKLDSFPGTLSGGEQQRVAVARALAHQPDIVLADEPTGNLDQKNAEMVVESLFSKVQAIGATLVIASHNPMVKDRAHQVLNL
ncbi:MAG: ABC transporter ATP-binding protein [Gammaproteobacteria bacterium]|nr:ABC transporter ATP-binding protein [Gammaproteobacteria bacterium]